MLKTYTATPATIRRDWFVVDAEGKTLGRLASAVAFRLRGKHKPEYSPNLDTGDYVIIINADKVAVTGRKANDKHYHHHTGYVGNLKSLSFSEMQARHPGKALKLAIKGMLPKGPLGRAQIRKLKIYASSAHNHAAQQPVALEL